MPPVFVVGPCENACAVGWVAACTSPQRHIQKRETRPPTGGDSVDARDVDLQLLQLPKLGDEGADDLEHLGGVGLHLYVKGEGVCDGKVSIGGCTYV